MVCAGSGAAPARTAATVSIKLRMARWWRVDGWRTPAVRSTRWLRRGYWTRFCSEPAIPALGLRAARMRTLRREGAVDRDTVLQVFEQGRDGHAGPSKGPGPAHALGIALHRRAGRPVHHSQGWGFEARR